MGTASSLRLSVEHSAPPALLQTKGDRESCRALAFCSQPAARELISYRVASRLNVLPLSVVLDAAGASSVLIAVFPKPHDPALIKEIEFASGLEVFPEYAPRDTLSGAIDLAYLGSAERLDTARWAFSSAASQGGEAPEFLDSLLSRAAALSASDIHLEPAGSGYRTRFRIDGLLKVIDEAALDDASAERTIRRAKVLANLDLTERRKPQDGGFTFRCGTREVRMRISAFPQHRGEKLVIRLLDDQSPCAGGSASRLTPFEDLGMSPEQARCLLNYLSCDRGVLLAAGPTGSGKSTLLYTALTLLNKEWRNISTLEDPVERVIPGISQVQVSREQGLDFADLLPALLRQDPDVIMLGEIRDGETAETALTAGLTGHLVLSTVHASNSFEVLGRLRQLGLDAALIAGSLRLVISQRLVAKNCTACIEPCSSGSNFRRLFNLDEDQPLVAGIGCRLCAGTGTNGRFGIFELMPVNEALRSAIAESAALGTMERVRETAAAAVHFSYPEILREKLISGIISPDSALRAMGLSPELLQY